MTCNPEEFRHLVEGFDLCRAKQDELIRTVWRVMENAVARAWKTDPVQLALADRDNSSSKDALDSSPVIELESTQYHELSTQFNSKKGGQSE